MASDKPLLTIYFDISKSRLKGGERKKLQGSLGLLKESLPLEVTGYTCDFGSQEVNDRLASERSQVVASFLAAHGISRKDLAVKGRGKCCYSSPDDRPLNRRVEIKTFKLKEE